MRRKAQPALIALWAAALFVISFSMLGLVPHHSVTVSSVAKHSIEPRELEVLSAFIVTSLRMAGAVLIALPFSLIITSLARRTHILGLSLSALLEFLRCAPFIGLIALFAFTKHDFALILATALSLVINIGYRSSASTEETPPALIELCQALGLTRWQMFWRCKAPLLTPGVVSALGASMSLAWLTLMGGEFIFARQEDHVISLGLGALLRVGFLEGRSSVWIGALIASSMMIIGFELLAINPARHWSQRFKLTPLAIEEESRLFNFFHRRAAPSFLLKALRRRALAIANWRVLSEVTSRRHLPSRLVITPPSRARLFPEMLIIIFGLLIWFDRAAFLPFHIPVRIFASLAETTFVVLLSWVLALLIWLPLTVLIRRQAGRQKPLLRIMRFGATFPSFLLFPWLLSIFPFRDFPPLAMSLCLVILSLQAGFAAHCLDAFNRFPPDLLEVARNLNVRGLLWWRKVFLPYVTPILRQDLAGYMVIGWNIAILADFIMTDFSALHAPTIGNRLVNAIIAGDVPVTLVFLTIITAISWSCVRLIEQDPAEMTT